MDQGVDKVTKEELIRRIQEGMKTEESAMVIYAKHLPAIVGRSGLPESRMSQIEGLRELTQ